MVNIDLMQQIIKVTGKQEEELKKELEEIYKELDKDLPDEIRKTLAFNRLVAQYRKSMAPATGTVEEYDCIFFGFTGDFTGYIRAQAAEVFKNSPEEAIRQKITDSKGNALYTATQEELDKMPDWAKKRIGTPIVPEGMLFGVVKRDDKLIQIQYKIRGGNMKLKIPKFTPVKLVGRKLDSTTEDCLRVNDVQNINLKIMGDKLTEDQIKKLFAQFKDRIITISDIQAFCDKYPKKMDRWAIMKVDVTDIVANPAKNGNQMVRVQDMSVNFITDDNNVIPPTVCWIPEGMDIEFPVFSQIYIVGQPNVNERGASINAFGIYVSPMFKKMKVDKLIPSEENSDIEKVTW